MPQNLTGDKSTLVQVMAWCRHATSHYLNQCWPRSPTPYSVTGPQWVKSLRPEQNAFCKRHIQVRFRIWGQISQEFVCSGQKPQISTISGPPKGHNWTKVAQNSNVFGNTEVKWMVRFSANGWKPTISAYLVNFRPPEDQNWSKLALIRISF